MLSNSLLLVGCLLSVQDAPFAAPLPIEQPLRLALTPVLDGRIANEEWQPIGAGSGVEGWFQWQPKQLHMAAKLPLDKKFVASLDLAGDGWLNGADNLEIVVEWNSGDPVVTSRRLDAARREGPAWLPADAYAKTAQYGVSADDTTWTIELTLHEVGDKLVPEGEGNAVGVRLDAFGGDPQTLAPYLPRWTGPVNLVANLGTNLPEGLVWKPELGFRKVVPGEDIPVRLTFEGNDELGLERIEMRTEGLLEKESLMTAVPFPKFDRKGRAFVDYKTRIADSALLGWRIMRGTIQTPKGPIVVRTSFEVTTPVTIELNLVRDERTKQGQRVLKFSVYLVSNTRNRLDGVLKMDAPSGWKLVAGHDQRFLIVATRGSVRRVIEAEVRDDVQGVFPLRFSALMGSREVSFTHYAKISPSTP